MHKDRRRHSRNYQVSLKTASERTLGKLKKHAASYLTELIIGWDRIKRVSLIFHFRFLLGKVCILQPLPWKWLRYTNGCGIQTVAVYKLSNRNREAGIRPTRLFVHTALGVSPVRESDGTEGLDPNTALSKAKPCTLLHSPPFNRSRSLDSNLL